MAGAHRTAAASSARQVSSPDRARRPSRRTSLSAYPIITPATSAGVIAGASRRSASASARRVSPLGTSPGESVDSAHATLHTSLAFIHLASRRVARSSAIAHRSEGTVPSVAKDHHATAWSLIDSSDSTRAIAASSALSVASAGTLPDVA